MIVYCMTCNEFICAESKKAAAQTFISPGDFVIVDYEGTLFSGLVMAVESAGATVRVLHQDKNAGFWRWPQPVDSILYKMKEVKEKIQPPTAVAFGLYRVPEL